LCGGKKHHSSRQREGPCPLSQKKITSLPGPMGLTDAWGQNSIAKCGERDLDFQIRGEGGVRRCTKKNPFFFFGERVLGCSLEITPSREKKNRTSEKGSVELHFVMP